ncbi:MAG TPA: hypothetical protein DCW90_12840 [Lachnospiraceae bacterium]|nr:hypothetical protein [Lachnospiraceae bacterium]
MQGSFPFYKILMVAGVGIAHDVDEVMSLVWELTPFPPYLSPLQVTTLFVRTIIKKIFTLNWVASLFFLRLLAISY